jgi:hypothetical protein
LNGPDGDVDGLTTTEDRVCMSGKDCIGKPNPLRESVPDQISRAAFQ